MAENSSSQDVQIDKVLPKDNRKSVVWDNFNLVLLTDGTKKAQCKLCGNLLTTGGNSTLTRHLAKACGGFKSRGDSSQTVLDNQGQIWVYDAVLQREMTTKCVIQMGLPFGAFDNPHMMKLIQKTLQPRYKPFFLTCDVWSAPSGSSYSYMCITAHWSEPGQSPIKQKPEKPGLFKARSKPGPARFLPISIFKRSLVLVPYHFLQSIKTSAM
ncbi:hypothetical protein OSB04_019742 [Centaurea solstitialis]|uniref:BED-type domain-containing protein n=1 Tax=Centaurea solstitialis TaxID=347529 RepID=A0AA38SQW8_9ASTR|nr:hypothetical protein OSB04_019742 [Centaurea solstitialis]